MTPSKQFVEKRVKAIETIRQNAPANLQNRLIKFLRPAVALASQRITDDLIPFGVSKFGGDPDVPVDFKWPTWNAQPLGFFGQINLEEVAPFDLDHLLPTTGLLAFFYRNFCEPRQYDRNEVRIFHFTDTELLRMPSPAGIEPPDCQIFPPQIVTFTPEWTTRDFYHTEIKDIWDYDEYLDRFLPLFGRTKNLHRILGWPTLVHDFVFMDAEQKRSGLSYKENEAHMEAAQQDWRLLLQLDFKDSDCYYGIAYFLIHKEDLLAGNWDAVQFVYHSD